MERADRYYRSEGATLITRFRWDDPVGRSLQQDDVDLMVEFDHDDHSVHISEKFRSEDHGDCMIELWSSFDDKTDGWAVRCFADVLYYFVPGGVYEVKDTDRLRTVAECVRYQIDWGTINKNIGDRKFMVPEYAPLWNGSRLDKLRVYKGSSYRKDGSTWNGFCIVVPWDYFKIFEIPVEFHVFE